MAHRRLPAEWEEQSGIMVTWPRPDSDWQNNFEAAEKTFLNIATQISLHELLLIVCADAPQQDDIQQKLSSSGANTDNVRFSIAASNDTWARDHGPITVYENNKPVLIDFTFNGWGKKYPSTLDNQISSHLYNRKIFGKTTMESTHFVLEGGSIESDGKGTLLTTRRCLLNPTRNPGLTQQDIENNLRQYLGVDRILWLNHGELSGDDTDSHIDTLARFCDENTIAYVECNDHNDEHYEKLAAMHEELLQFKDINNQPYKLAPLPLPPAKYNQQRKRLPATYANFLIINNAVLVPTYNVDTDKKALDILQSCFPGRKIINIDCCSLIEQFGSLHCVTMQFPETVLTQ